MNKVIFMGRLTRDPEVRYSGSNNMAIARFSIAVDRRFKREGDPEADFFNCTAFGKLGEFVEKYLKKGTKILMDGEVRNDNYTDKDGRKVYGFNFVANSIEFAESKKAAEANGGGYVPSGDSAPLPSEAGDDFMNVPDIPGDDKVPF